MIFYYMLKALFILNPIQDGGGGGGAGAKRVSPYQFFLYNFCNLVPVPDYWTWTKTTPQKNDFSGQILLKLRLW